MKNYFIRKNLKHVGWVTMVLVLMVSLFAFAQMQGMGGQGGGMGRGACGCRFRQYEWRDEWRGSAGGSPNERPCRKIRRAAIAAFAGKGRPLGR